MTTETPSPKPGLHPVFTVTNIQNKVRVLDGTKVTYASWVRLFKLHARGYKVVSHIDGTPSPAETDDSYESWSEVDAHVLQWIYGTLSDDLLPRVLEDESTAREAWVRVANIFNNNKGARAAALESEFNSLRLGNMPSLEAYCQRLREIAGMLKDVDAPVTDRRLVIQLVRGLPSEYDTVASFINQTSPNFETARSMLELELHRKSGTEDSATALAAPAAAATDSWADQPPKATSTGPPRSYGQNSGTSGNSRSSRRNNNGSYNRTNNRSQNNSHHNGSNNQSAQKPMPSWTPPAAWPSPWTPPPCPYPTYPGWVQPWPSHAMPQTRPMFRGQQPRHQGQAFVTDNEASQPTDLSQAFQALSVQSQVDLWFMDTGASSHMTADPGMISSPFNTSNIRSIYVGNGNSIPVAGSGTSMIPTTSRSLHLRHVLHTPNIIKNLISVRQFTKDNNVSVEFDPFGFSVKDIPTGKMILRSDSDGELYPVSTLPSSTTSSSSKSQPQAFLVHGPDVWHSRLGHPGAPVLHFFKMSSKYCV